MSMLVFPIIFIDIHWLFKFKTCVHSPLAWARRRAPGAGFGRRTEHPDSQDGGPARNSLSIHVLCVCVCFVLPVAFTTVCFPRSGAVVRKRCAASELQYFKR